MISRIIVAEAFTETGSKIGSVATVTNIPSCYDMPLDVFQFCSVRGRVLHLSWESAWSLFRSVGQVIWPVEAWAQKTTCDFLARLDVAELHIHSTFHSPTLPTTVLIDRHTISSCPRSHV